MERSENGTTDAAEMTALTREVATCTSTKTGKRDGGESKGGKGQIDSYKKKIDY